MEFFVLSSNMSTQLFKGWYSFHHKIHFILHCLHLGLLLCIAHFGPAGRCIFLSSLPTRSIALNLIFFTITIPWVVMIIALLVIAGFRSLLTQLFNSYPQRLILLHEGFIQLVKSFNSNQVHLQLCFYGSGGISGFWVDWCYWSSLDHKIVCLKDKAMASHSISHRRHQLMMLKIFSRSISQTHNLPWRVKSSVPAKNRNIFKEHRCGAGLRPSEGQVKNW